MKLKEYLAGRISHAEKRYTSIKESHGNNPNEKYTYYGGQELGYWQGMLNAYQNALDESEYSFIPKKENHKTLIHWCNYCKSFDECKAEYDKKNRGWGHTYIEEKECKSEQT